MCDSVLDLFVYLTAAKLALFNINTIHLQAPCGLNQQDRTKQALFPGCQLFSKAKLFALALLLMNAFVITRGIN